MITLPIYYTQEFRRKKDKIWLVGDNAFRNWHYHLKNKVKQHYHLLVKEQVPDIKITGTYKLNIDIYIKNPASDGSNIASRIEKFCLDALQEQGIVVNDNSKYHLGTTWTLKGTDKENPRAVITILEIDQEEE